MKLNKEDFDLIKKCIAIVIDRKVESHADLLAYLYNIKNQDNHITLKDKSEELALLFELELKELLELQNKLK